MCGCAATATPNGISGPGERHLEGIPLSVDLLTIPFGERFTNEAPVFRQDSAYGRYSRKCTEPSPPGIG
jgi:hypothetical protein